MTDRHRPDLVGILLLVVAAAALAVLIFLIVSHGRVLLLDRLPLLLAAISIGSLVAALRPVRRAAAAALTRSRCASPEAWAEINARPVLWVIYALWFATMTSLGEMAYLTYSKLITGYRVLSFDFMWRIPLGYALILSTIMLVCRVVAPGGRRAARALLLASFFVMAAGWLPFILKGLHGWAILLLAVGVAAQLTRFSGSHLYLLDRLVRRTAAATALVTIALAGSFYASSLLKEREASARLPPVSIRAPNVLLIVLDTVRASSLGLYGYHRATSPFLDRFATRGVVFTRAYATSPWTLPSYGSMFTGRQPHELSAAFATPLDATYPTLAEALASHGYSTSAFVANSWYGGEEFGLDRGFGRYEDHITTPTTSFMSTAFGQLVLGVSKAKRLFATHDNFGRKSAEDINRNFLSWLSERDTERPFFSFLNYCDAHGPYLPPEPFARQFSQTRPRGHLTAKPLDAWSATEIRELNDAYDSAVAYLDARLRQLFDELDHRHALDGTVVIVTSDHGEHFGEHNLLNHMYSLYTPLLHVPLVVVYPGRVPAGGSFDDTVSLRDIPSTVFALTGLQDRVGFPGSPMLPADTAAGRTGLALAEVEHLREEGVPEWYPALRGEMRSVIAGDWQYIRNLGDRREELFNLRDDPQTLNDVSTVESVRLQELRQLLDRLLRASDVEEKSSERTRR